MQERRIQELQATNTQLAQQLLDARAVGSSAGAAVDAARRTAARLALQLEAAAAEADALRGAAAAATAEAAGCAAWASQQQQGGGGGTAAEGVAVRDASLLRWFEGRLGALLGGGDSSSSSNSEQDGAAAGGWQSKAMALAREVRGLAGGCMF